MKFLLALLCGCAIGALLYFGTYDDLVRDLKIDTPLLHKETGKIAVCASIAVLFAMIILLIFDGGVAGRRKFTKIKDDKGKVIYNPNLVCKLGNKTWNEDEFCGHFLITGASGFGKTVCYGSMLESLLDNIPNMGGVIIDSKGDLLPALKKLMHLKGRSDDLIIVESKNPATHQDWVPEHYFNPIGDKTMPYSSRGTLMSDIVSSMFSGNDHPFFKQQGPDWFASGLELLDALAIPITIKNVNDIFTDMDEMENLVEELEGKNFDNHQEDRARLIKKLRNGLINLKSDGQRDGIIGSVRNMLRLFLTPGIQEVFSSEHIDTFKISDMDKGKIIVFSIAQEFDSERRAIFAMAKLAAYKHAKRRFDDPDNIKNLNVLGYFFDEMQNYVTASEDGESDHKTIDLLRAAKVSIIAGSQSTTSLISAFGDEKKAKTFFLNCTNAIVFRSADEDCAKFSADALGKKMKWERTYGSSGGKGSTSRTQKEKHNVEPFKLRALQKRMCYIRHVTLGLSKIKMPIAKSLFEKR